MTENPSQSQPDGSTPAEAPLDEKLHQFWTKNSKALLTGCAIVMIVILAKGAWEYMAAQKEAGVTRDYALATTPEKLKSFAAANAGHTLAGVAYLRLADEAYAADKAAEAVTNYEAAVKNLQGSPLSSRAELGLAMAKLQAGQTADGEAALKQIADRATESKGLRLEATYQLASLALSAGRTEDVKKYADQIMQIDASSPWAQRVMTLRASLPTPALVSTPDATATAAPSADEPAIKLAVPGGK